MYILNHFIVHKTAQDGLDLQTFPVTIIVCLSNHRPQIHRKFCQKYRGAIAATKYVNLVFCNLISTIQNFTTNKKCSLKNSNRKIETTNRFFFKLQDCII